MSEDIVKSPMGIQSIQIRTESDPAEHNLALGAYLDSPKNGQLAAGSEIEFSGWVLGPEENAPPRLFIEFSDTEIEVRFKVSRRDVTRKILNNESDNRFRCGFNHKLVYNKEYKLYIERNGIKKLWKKIQIVSEKEYSFNKLEYYISELLSSPLNPKGKNAVGNRSKLSSDISTSEIEISLSESIMQLTPSNIIHRSNPNEQAFFKIFLSNIRKKETISYWLNSAISRKFIEMPNVFSDGFATSDFSIVSDKNVNIIFFESENEPFIILQWVTFADAIYFPKKRVLLNLQHITKDSAIRSLSFAVDWIARNGDSMPLARKFGGIVSGFNRPYHFFYDMLPGLIYVDRRGLVEKIRNIYTFPRHFYVNSTYILNGDHKFNIVKPSDLRSKSLNDGEFFCGVGLHYPLLTKADNADLEETVLAAALRAISDIDIQQESSRPGLRIWWGVTGQKRTWKEQVEGSAYVLNKIYESYKFLEVIFDGWTSPIDKTEADDREISLDEEVVSKIKSLLNPGIVTKSVVGRGSLEKIKIGLTCDAFVANYATGSMHISRFAARPGVLHINTKMNKREHIHHRAVSIPEIRTKDLPEGSEKGADYISYSVDQEDILMLLTAVIEANNR